MPRYIADNTRRFKRAQAHSLVKFQIAEKWGSDEPFISNVKDLSASGLRFWSEVFFPEGTLLRISAWVPSIGKPLDALARVVRARSARSVDTFYLSVRFIEVDENIQSALNDFIEGLAANSKTRRFISGFRSSVRRNQLFDRI